MNKVMKTVLFFSVWPPLRCNQNANISANTAGGHVVRDEVLQNPQYNVDIDSSDIC